MKIQYCSDLHLEFPENRKFLARNPLSPSGDVLVLAGDIVPFADMGLAREFFNHVCDHFSAIYWVPGNHEYYGCDIADKANPLFEKVRDNLFLINNQSAVHGAVRFFCTTLWSWISPERDWDMERNISDFSAIREKGGPFTARSFSGLHEESLVFLRRSLLAAGPAAHGDPASTVVVTHHVPTLMNYPKVYKNSSLTQAFAVELFDLIGDSGAACWIYGHHHVNTPLFPVGATQMATNQLGYVHHHEHGSFRRGAVLEV